MSWESLNMAFTLQGYRFRYCNNVYFTGIFGQGPIPGVPREKLPNAPRTPSQGLLLWIPLPGISGALSVWSGLTPTASSLNLRTRSWKHVEMALNSEHLLSTTSVYILPVESKWLNVTLELIVKRKTWTLNRLINIF